MTAVENLIDQLTSVGVLEIPQGSNVVTYIIKQAKEMEKERIINAVTFGQNNHTLSISDDLAIAEQYYNQTFKSE